MLVTYSEFLKNAESNEICLNFIRPFPDLANSDFSSKSGRLTRRLLNNIFNCNTKKGIATDIGNQCTPLRNTTGDFRQICPKLISPHFKFGNKCPVLQSSPDTPLLLLPGRVPRSGIIRSMAPSYTDSAWISTWKSVSKIPLMII